MSVRLGLLLVLLFGAVVAYLATLNPSKIRVVLAPNAVYELPFMAVVVGVFLAGVSLAVFFVFFRDVGRGFRHYQLARRARRAEDLAEIYRQGVDAQLAGKPEVARSAYRELLAREPDHPDAHLRLGELARAQGEYSAAVEHDLHALRTVVRGDALLALAEDYDRAGRRIEALATYRQILAQDRNHRTALRAIRHLAALEGRWPEALEAQEALVRQAGADARPAELGWLAGIHYEIGKALLAEGKPEVALPHFRESLRTDGDFLPAVLALGAAHERMGETREAIRTWERAAEVTPALVLLQRLERAYHAEGRPGRMIGLYQDALARSPHDLSLAFTLGKVFFDLEMLDEASDQFQKVEVSAPDLPPVHAYLGAIFERRGESAEAFGEYRRALQLTHGFEWPHACSACGTPHPSWQDRCPACGQWNTSKPRS